MLAFWAGPGCGTEGGLCVQGPGHAGSTHYQRPRPRSPRFPTDHARWGRALYPGGHGTLGLSHGVGSWSTPRGPARTHRSRRRGASEAARAAWTPGRVGHQSVIPSPPPWEEMRPRLKSSGSGLGLIAGAESAALLPRGPCPHPVSAFCN
jgi:hypothetical protein